GGYGIVHFLPERDGLFSGLNILELMLLKGKQLSDVLQELFKEYGTAYYERYDMHAEEGKKEKLRKLIESPPEKFAGYRVHRANTLDGLKLIFENDGWILFRASGTEPLIRVYVEMQDEGEVRKLLAEALNIFEHA
ncbi:MAG: phosphoglucomutase/phosphomannomutase family protein, partial [Aquificaceae bacterium]